MDSHIWKVVLGYMGASVLVAVIVGQIIGAINRDKE